MHELSTREVRGLFGTILVGLLLLAAVAPRAQAAAIRRVTRQPCAALGVYTVGQQLLPRTLQPQAQSGGPARPSLAYPYPFGYTGPLSGTITLQAATGCGTPTVGSFAVQSTTQHVPLPESQAPQPRAGAAIAVPPPSLYGTNVLTATGTFRQDPTHPGDPLYVLVSAAVIYGRVVPVCPGVCVQPGAAGSAACSLPGCTPSNTAITRTAAFSNVTGFMRWQAGRPASIGLIFLPPPDPRTLAASAVLSLQPVALTGTRRAS